MNIDIIWIHGALTVLEATIAHSLNDRDVPCLVVEMGVGMRITPASHHAVGRWLQAGEVIGQVYDGFHGDLRHEITTPIAGLLSGIRRQPLLFEGDLIARLQSRHAVAEAVDTYLEGKGQ